MLTYMDKELGCSWWLLWRVSSVSASVMGQLEVCIYVSMGVYCIYRLEQLFTFYIRKSVAVTSHGHAVGRQLSIC